MYTGTKMNTSNALKKNSKSGTIYKSTFRFKSACVVTSKYNTKWVWFFSIHYILQSDEPRAKFSIYKLQHTQRVQLLIQDQFITCGLVKGLVD